MIYLNSEVRQRTTPVKNAAQVFAKMAGWVAEPCPPILSPALAHDCYCDRAGFLIAHWQCQTSLTRLIHTAAETRGNILMIEPSPGRARTFYVSLIQRDAGEIHGYTALRLWSSDLDALLWFIPALSYHCFKVGLEGMQRQCEMPLADAEQRDTGRMIAGLHWNAQAGNNSI